MQRRWQLRSSSPALNPEVFKSASRTAAYGSAEASTRQRAHGPAPPPLTLQSNPPTPWGFKSAGTTWRQRRDRRHVASARQQVHGPAARAMRP